MTGELERLISELEAVTARMSATASWEQMDEFSELLARRAALCVQLRDLSDRDASTVARIRAVAESGDGLTARLLSIRDSVLDSLIEIEAQRRFAHGVGGTFDERSQSRHVDLKA